jgi:hypothetical protein
MFRSLSRSLPARVARGANVRRIAFLVKHLKQRAQAAVAGGSRVGFRWCPSVKAADCSPAMIAQVQPHRLCATSFAQVPCSSFQRLASPQAIHLSSSRQLSETQLRQRCRSPSISRRQYAVSVSAQSSNGALSRPWGNKDARLVLEDGSVWEGRAFGAEGTALAETVFNTSLTGYQEILTDPSYKGQFVVFTHPHIGNVGINFGEKALLLHPHCACVMMHT